MPINLDESAFLSRIWTYVDILQIRFAFNDPVNTPDLTLGSIGKNFPKYFNCTCDQISCALLEKKIPSSSHMTLCGSHTVCCG